MRRANVVAAETRRRPERPAPLDVAKEHGIGDLGLEEVHRVSVLALVMVLLVGEEVGEHLDEVRFAGPEEARHMLGLKGKQGTSF